MYVFLLIMLYPCNCSTGVNFITQNNVSIYFTKKVEESKDNPKALFRLTRNMMGNRGETILPLHTCKRNLANDFSAFFYNKILTIRSELGFI